MPPANPPALPDVWVRFLETIEPTATDRTRYDADSEWAMSDARAEELLAAGKVELIDPPAATLDQSPAAAPDADEE